jgi:hypothetical protein
LIFIIKNINFLVKKENKNFFDFFLLKIGILVDFRTYNKQNINNIW